MIPLKYVFLAHLLFYSYHVKYLLTAFKGSELIRNIF